MRVNSSFFFFFFNDTATTEIYTLSLHDALPISSGGRSCRRCSKARAGVWRCTAGRAARGRSRATSSRSHAGRSEEHTSELQSRLHLVCRLLLEKKNSNATHKSHAGGCPNDPPRS